jgi:hypothetical protein
MNKNINYLTQNSDDNKPQEKPTAAKAQTVDDIDARKQKRNNILK